MQHLLGNRRHRVQPQHIEPRRAHMRPRQRLIVEPGHAERTAVAYALRQNPIGVRQVVAILPSDFQRIADMLRFDFPEAERHFADPQLRIGTLGSLIGPVCFVVPIGITSPS